MEQRIDKMQVDVQNKHMRSMLAGASRELSEIQLNDSSVVQDEIKYMLAYLYKISISLGHFTFSKEATGRKIQAREIDDILFDIDKLMKFQLSKAVHSSVLLDSKEIRENFEHWGSIPTILLLKIIIKEHYIMRILDKYFEIDMKWQTAIIYLICKLAQSSLNFVNIRDIKDTSIIHADMEELQALVQRTLTLQLWAAERSAEFFAIEKQVSWGAKAIQFWTVAIRLYEIIGDRNSISTLQDKIEGLQRRIKKEDSVSKIDTKKHYRVSELSLEDLLSNDDIK